MEDISSSEIKDSIPIPFFPWRKQVAKKLNFRDLTNVQKIVLVLKGTDPYGYDDVEYNVELLDESTLYNLKGEKTKALRWFCHTISEDRSFYKEYGADIFLVSF